MNLFLFKLKARFSSFKSSKRKKYEVSMINLLLVSAALGSRSKPSCGILELFHPKYIDSLLMFIDPPCINPINYLPFILREKHVY